MSPARDMPRRENIFAISTASRMPRRRGRISRPRHQTQFIETVHTAHVHVHNEDHKDTPRLHTRMLRENRNGHGATDARSVQARASKEHVPCAEAVNHAAACGTRAESARQRLGQKHHALGANALNAASKADALLHPPLSSDARAQRPLRRCRSRAPCSWQPRERRKPR